MLHYSAIIYWKTSKRNNEPIFKVHFYILDGEKLCCGLYSFDSSNWIGFHFIRKSKKKKLNSRNLFYLLRDFQENNLEKTISEVWPKLRFFFGYTKEMFFKISAQEPWKVCVK